MAAPGVSLRVLTPDEWPLFRELRLEALREAPHAFGSTLESWLGDGDTEERWRDRLTNVPFNVVAYFEGVPAGIVSGLASDLENEAELISMWVAPFARSKGVADSLVEAVVDWARGNGIEGVSLRVMEGNARARAFYRRQRFVDDGEAQSAPDGRPERRMLRRQSR
ncbi:MAG: GNAT family N-acetyltransferase [Candidatus Cybelea sp.]